MEQAKFAEYPTAIESFAAHAELIAKSPRYEMAMEHAQNAAEFATALKLCGYSTEPTYGFRLTQLIVEHELEQYDTTPPDKPATTQEAA